MIKKFKLSDYDYHLPKELIAQEPVSPRDRSRLLVLCKKGGGIQDKFFFDAIDFFRKGDVLVMNNSKVFPARLIGKKLGSGGKIEVFLHRKIKEGLWQCIVGGHVKKDGQMVEFSQGLKCEIIKDNKYGTWEVKFNKSGSEMLEIIEKIGHVPLPPYIRRRHPMPPDLEALDASRSDDKERYQTVYADDSKIGSVAAPTAGLHFTPELLNELKNKGVEILYISLHVGLGTFAPVKTDDITKHKMHAEYAEIEELVIIKIREAKKNNRRIIAVGTTSARAVEAFLNNSESYELQDTSYKSWVDIFIYPGYQFKIIDGMITNFHLPKSTLLMLVSALAGKENIDKAYRHAINNNYRFYSYGDAMLII